MIELNTMYKLFSDETRLRIMVLLHLDQLCVCQLTGILDVPQPRISKNLAKLRDLNIVEDVRKDKYVFYKLASVNELIRINLDHIVKNKELYPEIAKDIEKLQDKDVYTAAHR